MDCGARQAEGGACAACKEDPVLDLADPSVRAMLIDEDVRRREKRGDRVRYASVPVSIATVVLFLSVGGAAILPSGPFLSYWIGAMVAVALGVMKLADLAMPFRPRFADLTR
jgi:hypothetical protein